MAHLSLSFLNMETTSTHVTKICSVSTQSESGAYRQSAHAKIKPSQSEFRELVYGCGERNGAISIAGFSSRGRVALILTKIGMFGINALSDPQNTYPVVAYEFTMQYFLHYQQS